MFNTTPPDRLMSIKTREKLSERLQSASGHVLAADGEGQSVKSIYTSVKYEKQGSASMTSMSASQIRRKKLELAAAEAKAKIQLELKDKKLELDLAVDDCEAEIGKGTSKCPTNVTTTSDNKCIVNDWMEQNESVPRSTPSGTRAAEATEAARIANVDSIRAQALGPLVDSIMQLATTLKDIIVTSSTRQEERLLTKLSTPRELPIFSGDCIEWLHFKAAYDESTRVCNFTDCENLWRLRRALRGEAKESVMDLLIGNTAPAVVMEALELRFGNSELTIQHLTTQIKKLSPLTNNYQHDLTVFCMKINNYVATLHSLNEHLRSPELVAAVISKLPSILLNKRTEYAYTRLSSNIPKLTLLAAFLKREAEMISVVGVAHVRDSRIPESVQPNKKFADKCCKNSRVFIYIAYTP